VREALKNIRDALTQKQAAVNGLDGETLGRILDRGATLLARLDAERTNAYARLDQRNDAIGHLRDYDRMMKTMGNGRVFDAALQQN
jgi:ABC-type transporter Mla subunit MlaD